MQRFGKLTQGSDFESILEKFRVELQISAVLVWSHHFDLGLSKQIFCDLAASRDGKLYSKDNTRRTTVDEFGNLKAVDP